MKIKLFAALTLALIFFGCGSTQLVTFNSRADLYVNGIYKGKGITTIQRSGMPLKIKVDAKLNGRTIGSITEKRRFTVLSAFLGFYTYGIGFFCAWKFPPTIVIPVEETNETKKDNFDKSESIWDLPPASYDSKNTKTQKQW